MAYLKYTKLFTHPLENVRLKGFRNYKRYIDWILITFLFEQLLRKLEGKKFSFSYEWNQ
ncbi:hypothetical protein [Caldicellulosiruptor bescii]|nr:hypothetical protein [Caldicellulosiruptor bescii]